MSTIATHLLIYIFSHVNLLLPYIQMEHSSTFVSVLFFWDILIFYEAVFLPMLVIFSFY